MKLFFAAITYLGLFALHLVFILAFRNPQVVEKWLNTLAAFGGKPFPGTDTLLSTLGFWWLYPLIAAAVFVYYLVIRKKFLAPLLFMLALTLLWGVYFYGPTAALGSIV